MMVVDNILDDAVITALRKDQLIVAKTDTIYGVLALAESEKSLKKLYAVKQRPFAKSVIVLVADIKDIPGLDPHLREKYKELSKKRPTTIVTKVAQNFLPHLPHINETLAFRAVPESPLAELIRLVGYLVAPSANPEGQEPARNIAEAINYFHESVDVYIDSGEVTGIKPSQIIQLGEHGEIKIIRK